jgi:hypothetical protein
MDKLIMHIVLASLLAVELVPSEELKRHLLYAVFAALLNALAVGAPLVPGLRIFSPDPPAMRARLAWMFAYNPFFGFFIFSCPLS